MCGGDRHFIVGSSAFDLQYATKSTPFNPKTSSFGMSVVNELVKDSKSIRTSYMPTYSIFSLGISYKTDPEAYIDFYGRLFQRTCADYALSAKGSQTFFKPTIEYQTGHSNIENCSQFTMDDCAKADLPLLRLLCPVTCGCSNPMSGLYRDGKKSGCPVEKCQSAGTAYAQKLSIATRPLCADMSKAELDSTPGWKRFWDELRIFRPQAAWKSVTDKFLAQGCSALANITAGQKATLCNKGEVSGAMTPFCPASCQCNSTTMCSKTYSGCPASCCTR